MTERRPHWDDDLIESVFRIMDNYAAEVWRRVVDHGTPTFDIITAVEDWHEEQGEENLPLLVAMLNAEAVKHVRRAEKAEAAIARVREVVEHDGYTVTLPTANWNTQLESMDNPYRAEVVLSADILEALEVPNE